MSTLVQTVKYNTINAKDTSKMGSYVIQFVSDPYTLQEEENCDGKICTACELVFKSQYMNFMQDNTRWYWEQSSQQQK